MQKPQVWQGKRVNWISFIPSLSLGYQLLYYKISNPRHFFLPVTVSHVNVWGCFCRHDVRRRSVRVYHDVMLVKALWSWFRHRHNHSRVGVNGGRGVFHICVFVPTHIHFTLKNTRTQLFVLLCVIFFIQLNEKVCPNLRLVPHIPLLYTNHKAES